MELPANIAQLSEGHEEKFEVEESETTVLAAEGAKQRRFKCMAYTGVDVSRTFGRMVVNVEGVRVPQRMGMLLEHDDMRPVAVCDHAGKTGGKLKLEGYFLDAVASKGESTALIAMADQGFPLKMSIGIRFRRHSFVEEGVEFECNGRKLKGPMVVVDESDLFETSFIHVNPADLDTEASVMRAKAQEQRMADVAKEPEVTQSETLGGQTRDQILAEGERRAIERLQKEREYEAALHQAFPGKGEKAQARRAKAREDKLSLEEIQRRGLERMQNRLAKFEEREAEREAALTNLADKHETARSPGIDPAKATLVQDRGERMVAGPVAERVYAELRSKPALMVVFSGSNGGAKAEQVIEAWLKAKSKLATRDGRAVLCDLFNPRGASPTTLEALQKMAADVEKGLQVQRLDVGSSGPDYSKTTVNGFQGMFYNSYEEELNKNWSSELSFQIASDQQAEIVRWLGAPPMIQEWKGPRIAKNIPIYQQLIQSKKFEGTLHVDRFDWDHQKWDLIAKSFGLFGAVASQHWDIIFSQLLEANPTAYDGVALFASTHTLGGDSGTIVNDYTTATAGTLNVADPSNPTPLEWANIILQLTPKFRTFAWANGIKMHGHARQWGIMVHPNYEGNLQAAISMERLDLGASNPLFSQRSQYKVIINPYLTSTTYGYIFRLDTQNKALLRTEPDPLEMMWQGPGSHMAFHEDKYAMGLRCVRAIAPGAFESAMRFKVGA